MEISNILPKDKKIISIFPGSRISEIDLLLPILVDFMKLMNKKYSDFIYVFHSTESQKATIKNLLMKSDLSNFEVISDEKIKNHILKKSIFAVAKSGTTSNCITTKQGCSVRPAGTKQAVARAPAARPPALAVHSAWAGLCRVSSRVRIR